MTLATGPAPVADGPDAAFAAYQRGYHRTAYAEALKRLRADPADAAAMALIGQLYLDGVAVKPNDEEAARWFALAAERGDAPARFALGVMRLDGKGGPKDVDAAKALFERLAPSGHAGARTISASSRSAPIRRASRPPPTISAAPPTPATPPPPIRLACSPAPAKASRSPTSRRRAG
ncbi:MAG: sel1 repeat family protein [Rhodoblastus sp.]|nr:MAG: sel1 repeat family protein [Rhodoblastus sp.]